MTQITAYKVYTTGTSLAYCGVAGSAADAYVPSGTAICSDPFLQDQIATADGTDWQYVGENRSWTQPTMTGNQMTIGGSVWGIYESGGQTGNLWKISDKNGSSYWDAGRPGLPINVIFYNPNPVLATSVYFYNYSSDGINNYNFSGSNDNSTWTQLSIGTGKGHNQQWTDTITTSTPYKYFRLQVTQTLDSSGWLNLREVTISGTENVVADPVVSDLGSDSVRMFAVVPVTDYPYAHYEGTIYDIADAPAGAFGITAEEKTELEDAVSDGGTLSWYSDQRPYVDKYVAWTQPVLTSDSTLTVLGTVTASASSYYSGEEPWEGMNGIHSGTGHDYWASSGASGTAVGEWWKIVFPYQINITGLTYYNRYNHDGTWSNVTGQFWTSSGRTTSIGNSFGPTGNGNWTATAITGIPASGVLTDTIYLYFTAAATKYAAVGEIDITATRRDMLYEVPKRYLMQLIPAISESGVITNYYAPAIAPAHPYAHYEGTIYDIADAPVGAYPLTDLQYYTINYYVNAGGTLAWYSNQRPYVFTLQSWTQPVLTSNTSYGVASASSYYTADGGRPPYYALDGNTASNFRGWVASDGTTPQWWKWELPIKLRLSTVNVYNSVIASDRAQNIRLYSDDGVTPISDTVTLLNGTGANSITLYSGVHDITQIYIYCADRYSSLIGLQEVELTGSEVVITYEVPLTNFVS